MNKFGDIITVILIMHSLLLFSCYTSPKPREFSSASPKGTYTVRFEEKPRKETDFFHSRASYVYDTYFKILKHEHILVGEELLTRGEIWGQRFSEVYKDRIWVSDNVLRSSSSPLPPQSQCDEIAVSNNTAKSISFLTISTPSEVFLFCGILPFTNTRIYSTSQSDNITDYSNIGARCQFNDKSSISFGEDFLVKGKYKGPSHYSVEVTEISIVITSQEFTDSIKPDSISPDKEAIRHN